MALNARSHKAGISRRPKRGIIFPSIFDLALSLHFPVITKIMRQKARIRNGKGALSPGGIHWVLSEFRTNPPSHSLIVGIHDSSSSSETKFSGQTKPTNLQNLFLSSYFKGQLEIQLFWKRA